MIITPFKEPKISVGELSMKIKITYWYHSCFTLQEDKKVLLFDYPNRGIDSSLDEKIKSIVQGSELYIFISHAHGDHFSLDVTKFSTYANETHYVVSNDVPKSTIISKNAGDGHNNTFIQVDLDRNYKMKDLQVRAFKSNDAGVAFLIDLFGKKVYYGGDLAKWNWPEWSEQKVNQHVKVFDDVIRELKNEDVEIAFSNMDERLPSWAGPIEFIEKVKPRYFVPMHTFGNEEWLDDLINEEIKTKSEIFHYEKPGDEFYCEL